MAFEDGNGNGIMEAGEAGIPQVEVNLQGTATNGTAINQATTTDNFGKYSFDNLPPGTYQLFFSVPGGYEITYPDLGGDDNLDSDLNPTTLATSTFDLPSGQENLSFDAGFYRPATIGNFVWEDKNANGIQNGDEPGLADISITLTGNDGAGNPVSLTTTSNPDGSYWFDNLRPGTYQLIFQETGTLQLTEGNIGADQTKDSDADSVTGFTSTRNFELRGI